QSSRVLRAILVVAFAFSCSAPALADGAIAVVPLDGLGVEQVELEKLDHALADEVKALAIDSIAHDDVLRANKECNGDAKCLVNIGKDVHAGRVLAGSVGMAGDELHISLKVVDVVLAMEVGAVDDQCPADQAEQRVRAATMKLLAPDKYNTSGAILVSTPLAGAEIVVDGVKRGTTPLFGPVDGLAPGRRDVEVRYPGKTTWHGFVDVGIDEPERLDIVDKDGVLTQVPHAPKTAAPVESGSGLSPFVYVGVGVAALGVVALAGAGFAYSDAAESEAAFRLKPNSADKDRNQDAVLAYGILLGSGVGAVVVGAGLAVIMGLE
ncbi:MAG TPA: PEGA domain-containing protein, partial [Myxococcota bacterium]